MANKIAEAFIEISARGAEKAKEEIRSVTASAKKMSSGFDGALGKIGEKMDGATEGARKLQGAIGGVLGIVTVVAGAFFKLGNAVFDYSQKAKSAKERTKEFTDQLRASGASFSEQADAIRSRLQEVNDELSKTEGGTDLFRFGLNSARTEAARLYQEQIELTKELVKANRPLEAAKIREAEAIEAVNAQAAKQVGTQNDLLRIARLQQEASASVTAGDRERLEVAALEIDTRLKIADVDSRIMAARKKESDDEAKALMIQKDLILENARARAQGYEAARVAAIRLAEDEKRIAKEIENEKASAERRAREDALETARIASQAMIDANRQAAQETARAMREAVQEINRGGQNGFANIEGLANDILHELKASRGR